MNYLLIELDQVKLERKKIGSWSRPTLWETQWIIKVWVQDLSQPYCVLSPLTLGRGDLLVTSPYNILIIVREASQNLWRGGGVGAATYKWIGIWLKKSIDIPPCIAI